MDLLLYASPQQLALIFLTGFAGLYIGYKVGKAIDMLCMTVYFVWGQLLDQFRLGF